MEDVSEFLLARGVQEETILQMEEQKIDSDVIGLMDDATLQKYIPSYGDRIAIFNYCRRSDLIVTDSIYVGFEKMTEFTRTPIAHTCGNNLHIADSYENFPDLRSEFNAVLESNVWVMDIV
ncbi:Interferon-induced GTP-binding protein Mx [Dissostichus eleginoides]|uniref:Interferon-induced GTP-binding protein Mx n=1 Tax=Dissostichus eleginoides TaxID=100907 RepID=A0AAD9CBC6_DISEL|nr:Interferon-induced GTP-binding protein Mx [Dissostichus eleginoides]